MIYQELYFYKLTWGISSLSEVLGSYGDIDIIKDTAIDIK